jgi:hypothetical protein
MQFVITIPLGLIAIVALAIFMNVNAAKRRRKFERAQKLQIKMEKAAHVEAASRALAFKRSEDRRLKELGKLIEQPMRRGWRARLPFIGRNS